MPALGKIVVLFISVVLTFGQVQYQDDDTEYDEMMITIKNLSEACKIEFPIQNEDLLEMLNISTNATDPKFRITKCYGACLFKKLDWMDSSGHINKTSLVDSFKTHMANDDEAVGKLENLIETCILESTNSDPCEEFSTYTKCMVRSAPPDINAMNSLF